MFLAAPAQAFEANLLPAWVKVRPGLSVSATPTLALRVARGECEGFQVLVRATPAEPIDAVLPPLRGTGKPLAGRLYREAFLQVTTPSNHQGATGLWPDPLIPVEDAFVGERRNALPSKGADEKPLVLYGELCVPLEQKPGKYEGALKVTSGKQSRRLSLKVTVEPFYIPPTSSLKNSFGLSKYSAAKGHKLDAESAANNALLQKYQTALLSHRLSPYGGSMQPAVRAEGENKRVFDFSAYAKDLEPFFSGKAVPSGARFTTADVHDVRADVPEAEHLQYLKQFAEAFRAKGWKADLFYYAKDEPKPADYPLVKAQSKRAREAKIPVLITSPLDPELAPFADILSPTLNCFFEKPGPGTCKNVQSVEALRRALPGKQIWWYQSCNSHGCSGGPAEKPEIENAYSGWASYMIDAPTPLNRAMGPLAYLAGIDGELYFDTMQAFSEKPWESVWAFGGNGDGTFFYPGTPDQIGGKTHIPIESLRLKHVRDGLEDYEALMWLERLGEHDYAQKQVRRLTRSGYEIVAETPTWDTVRNQIYDRISARWQASKYAAGPIVNQ